MGPNEMKLQGIRDAKPQQLRDRAADWAAALTALYDISQELDVQEAKIRETWSGGDSDAALAAFAAKRQTVEAYQDKARMSWRATMEAAAAVEDGQAKLAAVEAVEVPAVSPAPTGPAPDGETVGKRAVEAYDDKVLAHSTSSDAHAAALDQRERIAGRGVTRMDNQFQAAQALLSKTVPPPPVSDTHGGSAGSGGPGSSGEGAPAGAGGSGLGTVVGGTTAVGSVMGKGRVGASKFATISRGGKNRGSDQVEVVATNQQTSTGEGSTQVGDLGTSEVIGSGGGGGAAGAAAGAGMLGAGKGIMSKLAGAKAAGASASGRSTGMQKGSTLGARGSSASAQGGGTARGAMAKGGSSAGASQTGGRAGGQSAAGSRGAAGQSGGRGTGGTGGKSAAGSRGAAGQSGGRAGAGTGAKSAAGGRGAAGTQGGRGAGTGTRGGAKAGRGPGAAAGRGGRQSSTKDDQAVEHFEFEDDQWIDDDETSPGVIS